MAIIQAFSRCLWAIFQITGNVMLWICLVIVIFMGLVWLNTENYQPNDTPHPQFKVAIIDEENRIYAIDLAKLRNETLATVSDSRNCMDDCFRQENGNFVYHLDSPMKTTDSEYKIIDGKVVPVSYSYFTILEGLEAFFLGFVGYAVVKYGLLRLWYRHSTEKTRELNQTALSQLKGLLMFIAIVVGFFTVLSFLNHF